MNTLNIEQKIDKSLQYLSLANKMDYIGEPVSQLEHALQCAYFAEKAGHSQEVILACLFHDIGHFASETKQRNMENLGIVHHEWIGAKIAYDLGLSAKVALLIGHHVNAKRYLAGKKKDYLARLSEASKKTLAFQGGVMSDDEMHQFECNPHYKDILRVRIHDEKAKQLNLKVPDLHYYRSYLLNHFKKTLETTANSSLCDYVDKQWVAQFKSFLQKESEEIS